MTNGPLLDDLSCTCSTHGPITWETDDHVKYRVVCCACFTQTWLHKSISAAKKSWQAGKTFMPAGL